MIRAVFDHYRLVQVLVERAQHVRFASDGSSDNRIVVRVGGNDVFGESGSRFNQKASSGHIGDKTVDFHARQPVKALQPRISKDPAHFIEQQR